MQQKHQLLNKPFSFVGFLMCTLAALFYGYEYYLRVAPSILSFELKEAYQISETGLGFLSAFFYFAYVPVQIPVGLIMDRFGPRKIITLATILCVIGTYFFAATNYLIIAQLGRFILGFGSAFAFVGVLKVAFNWLPPRFFAMMVGIASTLGMFSASLSQISMTHCVEYYGWRITLYYAVFFGLFLSVLLWVFLKNHPPKVKKTELVSTVSNISIISDLKTILINKKLWTYGIIGALTYMSLSVFAELWGDSFLIHIGYDKYTAAKGNSFVFLGFAVGGPIWGWLSDHITSRKKILWLGSYLAAASFALLILLPMLSINNIYCLLFFCGFFSSVEILIFAMANDIVSDKINATALSFVNMLVMFSGFVLQPTIGIMLDFLNCQYTDTAKNYRIILFVLPLGLILAGTISLCLQETYRKAQ